MNPIGSKFLDHVKFTVTKTADGLIFYKKAIHEIILYLLKTKKNNI